MLCYYSFLKRRLVIELETLQEQLINVRKAIKKAELSQSYKIDNKELIRANLKTLYAREKELLQKIKTYGANYIEGLGKSKSKAFQSVGVNIVW
jgi:hypothetical protein